MHLSAVARLIKSRWANEIGRADELRDVLNFRVEAAKQAEARRCIYVETYVWTLNLSTYLREIHAEVSPGARSRALLFRSEYFFDRNFLRALLGSFRNGVEIINKHRGWRDSKIQSALTLSNILLEFIARRLIYPYIK